jgi:hypothetical protein
MSFVTRWITRSWVLAVLGALALFALLVILGDSTASATLSDGDVVLGAAPVNACTAGTNVNCTNSLTGIVNTTSGGDAFHGFSSSGIGVGGFSDTDSGVKGQTAGNLKFGVLGINTGTPAGIGVEGEGDVALRGEGTTWGLVTHANNGVSARAFSGRAFEGISSGGEAVYGQSDTHDGVIGLSSTGPAGVEGYTGNASTVGVWAHSTSGNATALKATGKTSFSRSGKLTVPSGSSSATKSAINLTSSSMVFATIQGNQAGVYVQGVTQVAGTSGSFTIHLSKNTTANLPVAWFVVN